MMMTGEGSSETAEREAEVVTNAVCFDNAAIFHVIKSFVGFILYMHQQIPSVLQDITLEFDSLQNEHKELEKSLTQPEIKASVRREQLNRKREIKYGIKRFEKLINTIDCLESALQMMITEVSHVQDIILVLGANPMRPQHVYELCFSHGNAVLKSGAGDFSKSKAAEVLSRKVVRALISFGSGPDSYLGPTKLFLLVKAPSSFNLPLHFLPKRDFRYSKKIIPYRLQLKCRTQGLEFDLPSIATRCSSIQPKESNTNDLIWYQCRHVVKGIVFKTPEEE